MDIRIHRNERHAIFTSLLDFNLQSGIMILEAITDYGNGGCIQLDIMNGFITIKLPFLHPRQVGWSHSNDTRVEKNRDLGLSEVFMRIFSIEQSSLMITTRLNASWLRLANKIGLQPARARARLGEGSKGRGRYLFSIDSDLAASRRVSLRELYQWPIPNCPLPFFSRILIPAENNRPGKQWYFNERSSELCL